MNKSPASSSLVPIEPVTLGPAMQRLSAKRQRFAFALVKEVPAEAGAEVAAAQIAGYVGTPAQIRATASRLVHDENVIDAVIELARQEVMMSAPAALRTIRQIADNKFSKDQLKAAQLVLDRFMPATQQISVKTEVVDYTGDSLKYLLHLRSKGATEDFLIGEFGEMGLARLSALLAAQEAAKANVIDAEFQEVGPAPVSERTPSQEQVTQAEAAPEEDVEEF